MITYTPIGKFFDAVFPSRQHVLKEFSSVKYGMCALEKAHNNYELRLVSWTFFLLLPSKQFCFCFLFLFFQRWSKVDLRVLPFLPTFSSMFMQICMGKVVDDRVSYESYICFQSSPPPPRPPPSLNPTPHTPTHPTGR